MKNILITVSLLMAITGLAQTNNLVMNPGFEQDSFCTDFSSDGIWSGAAKYWHGASWQAGLGYFNTCVNDLIFPPLYQTQVPMNGGGYEFPHGGIAYAGMFVFANIPDGESQRGYIQGTLRDTLKHGISYAIQFYVSLAEHPSFQRYCMDKIGFYFSDTMIYYASTYVNLPLTPQYENPSGNVLNVFKGWQKLEGSFVASGGEKYFTIGNFKDNAHSPLYDCLGTGIDTTRPLGVYSYIDDISVIDTSLVDTVQLCYNDSIYLQGAWRKTSGIWYDTVAGLPYRRYVNPVSYAATHTQLYKEGFPGDSLKTAYFMSYVFAGKDTTFSVTLPSVHGCDSIIVCRLKDKTIGIKEPPLLSEQAKLLIYPNPAQDQLNLRLENSKSSHVQVNIYDFTGRQVKLRAQEESRFGNAINYQLNISALSSGMYFVRLSGKSGESLATGRFVKE